MSEKAAQAPVTKEKKEQRKENGNPEQQKDSSSPCANIHTPIFLLSGFLEVGAIALRLCLLIPHKY